MSNGILLIQGVVPDYRLPIFDALVERLPGLKIAGGDDYFTPNIINAATNFAWFLRIENRYSFGRRLLWQQGAIRHGCSAGGLLIELNPRIVSGVVLVALRAAAGRPTVVWGHVAKAVRPNSVAGWIRRAVLELSDGFVAYTRADQVLLQSSGYSKPIWVTNNSCLHRAECVFSTGGNRYELIYVGRLVKPKKVHVLIEAFARAVPHLPKTVRLRLIGDGPERAALETQATAAGLGERVDFAGHQNAIDYLRPAYARAFLAASPGYVGLSVIQALGHGVPVLVSRNEPHSPEIEACREGENSMFFKTDDASDAADRIVEAWQARRHWADAGPSIAGQIAGRYTYEAMTDALEAALQWQIAGKKSPATA